MSSKDDYLDIMLKQLTEIRKKLVSINELSGALKRVHMMRREILGIGWEGIVKKYHPDVNNNDPAANELFKMYKYVYDDMHKRLIITKQ